MNPPNAVDLEIRLRREDGSYRVQLRFDDPRDDGETPSCQSQASLDPKALLALLHRPNDYGKALTAQLFEDANVRTYFLRAKTVAGSAENETNLRVRITVERSAFELHSVCWELIRDPENDRPLATSAQTLLSRFMDKKDWRRVRPRPRVRMNALVAVAAPSDVDEYRLARVDREGESQRARDAFNGVEDRERLSHELLEGPVTLRRLEERLRQGVDVLYLVAHGTFHKKSVLYLENEDGLVEKVDGEALAQSVADLERRPRLVVLTSCESDGDVHSESLAALAPLLADAGVPAILAMQGKVSMQTVAELMPIFFRELVKDGQIDRALAVARGAVRGRPDHWMPVLYLRLKGGRLWNDAGFQSDDDDVKWKSLVRHIRGGKCVPIIGSGVAERIYGSSNDTALGIAKARDFPLSKHQHGDLPRVLQFVSIKDKETAVQQELFEQWRRQILARHNDWLSDDEKSLSLLKLMEVVGECCRLDADEPHRILAEMRLPIYVNANWDHQLGLALRGSGRTPQPLVCLWRKEAPVEPRIQDNPSFERPVVHHIFGLIGKKFKDSLVLTEDDYFDYLIATSSGKLIPGTVESALVGNSLLFVGFQLTDWSFRVLFRLILSLPGRELLDGYPHVAVQVDPASGDFDDAAGARRYLQRYFNANAAIDVYWGTAEDFLEDLQHQLRTMSADIRLEELQEEEEDYGWDQDQSEDQE